tara:strand:- start:310 stop:528 length:219 start_codon:yes stop_codon:yes gene_type:complete
MDRIMARVWTFIWMSPCGQFNKTATTDEAVTVRPVVAARLRLFTAKLLRDEWRFVRNECSIVHGSGFLAPKL